MTKTARLIAFYLPQYYPTPENDEFWGKGFTEWTNVKKAKPLFPGHHQPVIPGELGYYDLRDPAVRLKQAELAENYGIEGFCYWHYWFGNGRRILHEVFDEVLKSGKPDFPFCLGWANDSWSGKWHGNPEKILMKQEYPGIADYKAHFYEVLAAFKDRRYINVDGKPLFCVYNPDKIPQPRIFIDLWRGLAVKEGFKGLYLVAFSHHARIKEPGFDATIFHQPLPLMHGAWSLPERVLSRFFKIRRVREKFCALLGIPAVYSYKTYVKNFLAGKTSDCGDYPHIVSNWDNTPRCGKDGTVFIGSNPGLFKKVLEKTIKDLLSRDLEHRIIFIKSWNEWAEGNYIEPDARFGRDWLEAIKEEVFV